MVHVLNGDNKASLDGACTQESLQSLLVMLWILKSHYYAY